jgi:hypothetical protein
MPRKPRLSFTSEELREMAGDGGLRCSIARRLGRYIVAIDTLGWMMPQKPECSGKRWPVPFGSTRKNRPN